MKKLYTLLAGAALVLSAFAQSPNQAPNAIPMNKKPVRPLVVPPKPIFTPTPQLIQSFIMDYDTADAYTWQTGGDTYDRFIWDHNWNYSAPQGDSSLKHITVSFDTIVDSYNISGMPVGIAPGAVQSVRVDSIYIAMGQENNSGQDDTLIIKLMSVTANRYPSTTVYWSDTIYFPQDIPHGTDWLQAYLVTIPVGTSGFTIPSNGDFFSVRLEYHGNKQDTCGVIAGFGSLTGPCGTSPSSLLAYQTQTGYFKVNATTKYYANSFSIWTEYESYGNLPTNTGANLYYDCDGSGGVTSGDGANYIQNWNISAYVTLTTNVGIENIPFTNGIKLGQNMPNPTSSTSVIHYELEKNANVKMDIRDITGKLVLSLNEGNQTSGVHSVSIDASTMAPGVYFYTLNANGNLITKKMTVTK
jgi:hypothetical protein